MRMSILKSPKAPDGNCDIGVHTFKYAIVPHQGGFMESQVVKEGYQYNVPLVVVGYVAFFAFEGVDCTELVRTCRVDWISRYLKSIKIIS